MKVTGSWEKESFEEREKKFYEAKEECMASTERIIQKPKKQINQQLNLF